MRIVKINEQDFIISSDASERKTQKDYRNRKSDNSQKDSSLQASIVSAI